MIQHERVKSSNVFSLAYDPEGRTLEARFACPECKGAACEKCSFRGHGKTTYVYQDVLPQEHEAIRDANSVGRAFHAMIVKPKKEFTTR